VALRRGKKNTQASTPGELSEADPSAPASNDWWNTPAVAPFRAAAHPQPASAWQHPQAEQWDVAAGPGDPSPTGHGQPGGDQRPQAERRRVQVYDGELHPQFARGFDGLLSVHRPVVLAHIRSIRKRHPQATPAELIRILEHRYLAAVTTGGAAVGASAVIPAVGVGISLALTSVETAGFLEASALFAQSITEIHGIAVSDPVRARTLVMSMMLGTAGADLVRQLAGQISGTGIARSSYWGAQITRSLPQFAIGPLADKMKMMFIKQLAARTGAGAIGRMVPFGVGAVIGGAGNHLLGRKVVASSRYAFGPAPAEFPAGLEPQVRLTTVPVAADSDRPAALPATPRTARRRDALARFVPQRKKSPSITVIAPGKTGTAAGFGGAAQNPEDPSAPGTPT
jgi:hypothetical protein